MKQLLYILFLISYTFMFSQSKEGEMKALYASAIDNHMDNAKKLYDKGVSKIHVKELYFIADMIPKEHLPNEVKGYKINYINMYKKNNKAMVKKGIKAISIQPMQLEENRILIDLIDFSITHKKGNYHFSNGGGSTTVFEYSCQEKKWMHKETKFNGI